MPSEGASCFISSRCAKSEMTRQYTNGCFLQHTLLLAGTASRALVGMHNRDLHFPAPDHLVFNGDCFVLNGTDSMADAAVQASIVEAVLMIDQHCDPHVGIADIGDVAIERTGWTRLCTRHVRTHVAGSLTRYEIRGTERRLIPKGCKMQRVIGAGANTKATTNTSRQKFVLRQSAWWS